MHRRRLRSVPPARGRDCCRRKSPLAIAGGPKLEIDLGRLVVLLEQGDQGTAETWPQKSIQIEKRRRCCSTCPCFASSSCRDQRTIGRQPAASWRHSASSIQSEQRSIFWARSLRSPVRSEPSAYDRLRRQHVPQLDLGRLLELLQRPLRHLPSAGTDIGPAAARRGCFREPPSTSLEVLLSADSSRRGLARHSAGRPTLERFCSSSAGLRWASLPAAAGCRPSRTTTRPRYCGVPTAQFPNQTEGVGPPTAVSTPMPPAATVGNTGLGEPLRHDNEAGGGLAAVCFLTASCTKSQCTGIIVLIERGLPHRSVPATCRDLRRNTPYRRPGTFGSATDCGTH